MASTIDFDFYVQHRKEERYLEYKRAMIWTGNDTTKIKIAKAMMAMSNLRNGGVIVVGMKEVNKNLWEPETMTEEQWKSFNHDDIAQWVNDYAVPAVQFTVEPYESGKDRFVVIQVREFNQSPTICRKQRISGGEDLKAGAIYYRSNRKNESALVSSEEDMRELVRLAIDKGVTQEINRMHELGLVVATSIPQQSSASKYEEERNGL
jgi:predicted HTH transcriptional regulator